MRSVVTYHNYSRISLRGLTLYSTGIAVMPPTVTLLNYTRIHLRGINPFVLNTWINIAMLLLSHTWKKVFIIRNTNTLYACHIINR